MKWTTANGREIEVRDMTDSHLTNTVRFIRLHRCGVNLEPLYEDMRTRLAGPALAQAISKLHEIVTCGIKDEDIAETVPVFSEMLHEMDKRGLTV